MKKIFYTIIAFIITTKLSYADSWLFWSTLSETDIRNWNIHTRDIAEIIKWGIDFFIGIAWSIAVIFIIIWAYKILLGSLEQDKTKWKDTIIMALGWFIIAALAWFIIKLLVDNLGEGL